MPFITEEIYTSITDDVSIMVSDYPVYAEKFNFEVEEEQVENIKNTIRAIRNIRSEMNVPPSKKTTIYFNSSDEELVNTLKAGEHFFKSLSGGESVIYNGENEEASVSVVVPNATIYIPLNDLVEIDKEIERLTKEKEKLTKEVDRVVKKLSNQGFVSKAPEKVINEEKEKQAKYENMLEEVNTQLNKYLNM